MALFATVQVFAADPTRYLLSTWPALWTIVRPFDTRCPHAIFLNASSGIKFVVQKSAPDEVTLHLGDNASIIVSGETYLRPERS